MESVLKYKNCVLTAIITVCCAGVVYTVLKYKHRIRRASDALKYMSISIVTSEEACNKVIADIRRRCKQHNVIGFDCEWVTVAGKRQAVALLQLSTIDGFCGLFRLNKMKAIPDSLKALLEDNTVYKVGVVPLDDAKNLNQDYGCKLKSSLDVRHLAQMCGYNAGGLANLSEAILLIRLDKHWKVRCSDWEAEQLTDRQVTYAAADAHVAIKIFDKLINEFMNKSSRNWLMLKSKYSKNCVDNLCRDYSDVPFKSTHNAKQKANNKSYRKRARSNAEEAALSKRDPPAGTVRTKPLYNNCFLQAPDGDLLCTCDIKKALWYVQKGLAWVVSEQPMAVRLHFEPAGRSVGDVGRYYQLAKENKCVVCGSTDSYIRKNVVPREYRRHFPEVMKDHSSHDVVLLCIRCHQVSNVRDLRMRELLAAKCAAPLSGAARDAKHKDDSNVRKVRSAARALLYQTRKHSLPEERRRALQATLLRHYPRRAQVTRDLLEQAAVLQHETVHVEEETHGTKVVEYHLKHEGLLRLEESWREHFLTSMEPAYMPELWSTKHNEQRLRVKFDEGRLSDKDLQSIGLTEWTTPASNKRLP